MLAHLLRSVKYVLTSDSNERWEFEENRSNRASQNSVLPGWRAARDEVADCVGVARDEFQDKEVHPPYSRAFLSLSLLPGGRLIE